VITTLNAYLTVLSTGKSVQDAAEALISQDLVAGHLISSDGKSVPRDIVEYSLKKDYTNISFYTIPADISRVTVTENDTDGFNRTIVKGTRYKIWIRKKRGVPGIPAPIPVIKPEKGKPKVVSNIGSL
jgi:hypothetical protein